MCTHKSSLWVGCLSGTEAKNKNKNSSLTSVLWLSPSPFLERECGGKESSHMLLSERRTLGFHTAVLRDPASFISGISFSVHTRSSHLGKLLPCRLAAYFCCPLLPYALHCLYPPPFGSMASLKVLFQAAENSFVISLVSFDCLCLLSPCVTI